MKNINVIKIAVIGQGYVGLPLTIELSKYWNTIGFDIDASRIKQLNTCFDKTQEVSHDQLESQLKSGRLSFSYNIEDAANYDVFIVTVPTPIDSNKQPDLGPLISSSKMIGSVITKGALVIYESTVYPGVTEEICANWLEQISGLKYNEGFFLGYSPERINPGDKHHTIAKIKKVTSGSTPAVADYVDKIYGRIIEAGTYKATSIMVAEAAKVIENIQRDINIALMNELALIFERLGIRTKDVLDAAGTKWNFLKFSPGLVGGHCIGVDPYYLTTKAESVGYHPEIVLSGRRINDSIAPFIAQKLVKLLIHQGVKIRDAKVLILGLTFKENVPDLRNSKIPDIVTELVEFGIDVKVTDYYASATEAFDEYRINLIKLEEGLVADAVILAVPHDEYMENMSTILSQLVSVKVVIDVKSVVDPNVLPEEMSYWSL